MQGEYLEIENQVLAFEIGANICFNTSFKLIEMYRFSFKKP